MGRIPTIHDQDIGDNIELIFPFLEGGMSLAEAKEEQNAANFTQAKERLKTKLLPIQNRQLARMIQHMAMQKAKNEAELLPPPDVLEEKDVMDKHKLYVMEKVVRPHLEVLPALQVLVLVHVHVLLVHACSGSRPRSRSRPVSRSLPGVPRLCHPGLGHTSQSCLSSFSV
jgi:hypothetical protein